MNPREIRYCKRTFSAEDISDYVPASVLGNMVSESGMVPDYLNIKADVASSESARNDTLYKLIEEIIEQTLPKYPDPAYQEFVDFRPVSKPRIKGKCPAAKQPEEELSVGDTSSLDAFMGEFTVSKRVGE